MTALLSSIENLLEQALQTDNDKKQAEWVARHPQGKVNPSVTDFGRCPRAVWYSLVGARPTNPPDIQSLANFMVGHAVEDGLGAILSPMVKLHREIHIELPGPDGRNTTGRADFLLELPDIGALIELKTTKQRQVPFLPQSSHVKQLKGYIRGANLGLIPGIEEARSGILAYFVKDAVRGKKVFYLYEVPDDPASVEEGLQANALISQMAERGKLPNRPEGFTEKKFPCSYCEFKDGCWS